jgi:hypothetical protein
LKTPAEDLTRTIRSVTWLPEEERLELRLILPQPEEEAAANPLELVVRLPWKKA